MKKALIAGAASLAVAAMPVVGVFAADTDVTSKTDTINVTIGEICTLVGETAHGAGTAEGATAWTADKLTVTATNIKQYPNIGTSTFKVTCNNNNGFSLTAVTNDLAGKEENLVADNVVIPAKADFSSAASGYALKVGTGEWMIGTAETEAEILTADAPVNEQSVTVTYGLGIDEMQDAGTYEGTVVYSLAQL